MIKTILLSLLLMVSFAVVSQIKTTQVEKPVKVGKVMGIECTKQGDTYTITYRDYKFTQIVRYKSFTLNEQEFNELYDLIKENMENPPGEDIIVETSNDVMRLKFPSALGIVNVQIYHSVNKNPEVIGLTRAMSKKHIDKLFGKK